MTTQDPDGQSLGDQFADAAKPRGTMSTDAGKGDAADAESASDALEDNTESLAAGENPFAQGGDSPETPAESVTDQDEDDTGDGAAGPFAPGRTDQT